MHLTVKSHRTVLPGHGRFVLEACIANGNTLNGFSLQHSLDMVEVKECTSTNNGFNGIEILGRNVVVRNSVFDLNANDGIHILPYFPFVTKVATDTPLENLSIYGGNYTLQYVSGPSLGLPVDFAQYIDLVPNVDTPVLPYLSINGVGINNGDSVLVKNETAANAVLNGVYVVSTSAGEYDAKTMVTTPLYRFIRADQWRAPQTVRKGTKILVEQSNAPNVAPGPVVYKLQNRSIDVRDQIDVLRKINWKTERGSGHVLQGVIPP